MTNPTAAMIVIGDEILSGRTRDSNMNHLARELTKTFETLHAAPLDELVAWVAADADQQRGECVLVVEGAPEPEADEVSAQALHVLDLLLAELPVKRAARLAAEITGVRKNLLYQVALERGDGTAR